MQINVKLLPHQYAAVSAKERIIVMSMGVGSGKTSTVALIAIINMLQGKRILVIEPTYSQIVDPFMREVEKQMVRHGLMIEGTKIWNLNKKNLKYMSGEIIARSAEGGKSAFAGIDGINTVIIDEASEIADFQIFTEAKNRQRKAKFPNQKKIYVVGTGCCGEHWLKDIALKPNTLLLNACYHDNYFLDPEDIEDYSEDYGENSIFPKSYIDQYVYGKFVDGGDSSLFTEIITNAPPKPGIKVAGYDCAYSGTGDDSVICVMNGNILEAVYVRKTRGDIEMKEFQNMVDLQHKPDFWNYDSTGNAVILKGTAIGFANAGGQFANMRTRIYFDLKRKLREGIHVPQHIYNEHWKPIKQELDATSLNLEKESKKPALTGKAEIKKKLKRSPDRADALSLACIPPAGIDHEKLRRLQMINNPYG
ncbi:MAG: phage terminase large subunit [Fibromonadaceae bacterium]|jgi:hypothetical protein|nr:phage terminase large subunit [Fibromonadaceae bacterium]